jgi:hypothetical protein
VDFTIDGHITLRQQEDGCVGGIVLEIEPDTVRDLDRLAHEDAVRWRLQHGVIRDDQVAVGTIAAGIEGLAQRRDRSCKAKQQSGGQLREHSDRVGISRIHDSREQSCHREF